MSAYSRCRSILTYQHTYNFDKANIRTKECCTRASGKLVLGSDGVEIMKKLLYKGSRKIEVDTDHDECLYAAPRPSNDSPEFQRLVQDLYIHTDPEENITFYLHIWEINRAITDKVMEISPSSAERFLRDKGLICNLFPKSDSLATLYQWGYGMAGEF